MPRKARNYYLSDFYHLMVQGDEKKFIFNKDKYKEKFIYLLNRNAFRNDVKLIAYCVMDNHVHILVHSKEQERISKMMSQCNTSYGLFFSKERKNIGHVFRDRFKSEPIYKKDYLINCIKYIHQNPTKANIVKNCQDYIYSSYNNYLNKKDLYKNLSEIDEITDEEYQNIINGDFIIDKNFIEIEGDYEDSYIVFENIKKRYNLIDLKNEDIIEIYHELKEKCNTPKSTVAKLLNIERNKFAKIIQKTY